jgi:hypothetical protein
VIKYWIFRYLNRISPSAVATYRNMNEWFCHWSLVICLMSFKLDIAFK